MYNPTNALVLSGLFIATNTLHADSILVPAGGNIQAAINIMSDGDTIQLEVGTYQPASTLDTNGKALTILGVAGNQGQPLSIIDGQDAIRIMVVNSGEGQSTVLENLVFINGNATNGSDPLNAVGAAIYCDASPTIRNCRFTANQSNTGALAITGDGAPVVTGCTFTNNVGLFCSAIAFPLGADADPLVPVTIQGCSFTGNETTLLATNTGTVAFNDFGKQLQLKDCTFSDNIGETTVFAANDVVIEDCTFNNSCVTAVSWSGGTVVVRDSELIGTETRRGLIATPFGPGGDFVRIEGSTFRGFGGHALGLEESSADGSITDSDFRDNRFGLTAVTLPTNRTWTVTNCFFTGNLTALGTDGGAISGSNITFEGCGFADNGARSGSAVLGTNLTFTDCFIDENGVGDGGGVINATGRLVMTSCQISNNGSSGTGCGVLLTDTFDSTSTITDCLFFRNFAPSGGGMACFNATVDFIECTFDRNQSSLTTNEESGTGGGGIVCQEGTNATFTDCTFTDNQAGYAGGGVTCRTSNATFNGCTFDGNISSGFGGGMLIFVSSTLSVADCTFTGNVANEEINLGSGGAFYMANSIADFDDVIFTDNIAREGGGMGIWGGSDASFNDCTFARNTCRTVGGAAWAGGNSIFPPGEVDFSGCTFDENESTDLWGGALRLRDFDASVVNCVFSNNRSARYGGAMWCSGTREVTDCTFTGNTASEAGGGIYFSQSDNSPTQVIGCDFFGNDSPLGGGIFINTSAEVELQSTRVCGNTIDQIAGDPYTDLGGNTINDEPQCGCLPGDTDCNLVVDGSDLSVVLGNWGPCTSANCVADLDGNGTVDGADLSILLGNWGPYDG